MHISDERLRELLQKALDFIEEVNSPHPRGDGSLWLATEIEAALELSRRAAEQQEPVGYQHRVFFNDTGTWSAWRDGRMRADLNNAFEERPLFASPQPPVPLVSDEVIDRIGEIVHGRHERGFVMWPLMDGDRQRQALRALLNGGSNGR